MAKALMYLAGGTQKAAFRKICGALQVACITVTPADLDKTISQLAGLPLLPGMPPAALPSLLPPRDLLVFCGFSDSLLDRMLAECRGAGLGNVLKAAATPINAGWTLRQLSAELAKEQAALAGRNGTQ